MSKNILKLLTLCLALLVGESAVWAATTVNLWHSYRAKEKKAIEEAAAQFNAKGGDVEIKLLYVPYDAFADKITAAVPRGKGPDLFIFAQDRVGDWAVSELIEPLDFWMTEELEEAFLEPTLEALTYDDSVYGLPMTFKMVALFYNKKLVKAPPKTTDELIATAKALTNPDAKKYGLVYENANFYYQGMWLQGFGGRVFGRSGKPELASEQCVASMKFAQDLARGQGIMPEEISSVLVTTLFNNGQAAMVIDGPWFIGSIENVDFGVAVLPTITATGKPATPFLTSEGIIMSAKSEHKKEAFEVMKFMTSTEVGRIMASKGRQTVARSDVYDDPAIAKDPVLAVFRRQLKNSRPMPNSPAMKMVWRTASSSCSSAPRAAASPRCCA
jgi:arabinogalactan oligomer/maltooligosaccharide transport system substrate-binding protein